MLILERITGAGLKRTPSLDKRFCRHFQEEIEAALAARAEYDADILDALRQYEGVPKVPYRNSPIENAPNIEITLGAIATDALYAQAITTIFSVNPILTVAATKEQQVKQAQALQDFCNWGIENEFGVRECAEHAIMDVIQLGTGAIYTPYVEVVRKTQTRRIIDRGPRCQPIPIENLIVPGGTVGDVTTAPWVAIRMFLSFADVKARAMMDDDQRERWTLDRRTLAPFLPCASLSQVQMQREAMSRTTSNTKQRKVYEVYAIFCTYDYDKDGEDEELLAFWDRSSSTLGWIDFTPHDYRPINKEVYQVRAHSWNGLGVMKMLAPYEEEVTQTHNDKATNVKLANFKVWGVKEAVAQEGVLTGIPNRIIPLGNPKEDLVALNMGEVYPSEGIYEATTLNLAERRVGLSDLGIPRPSQVLGTRTPATTAASLLQAGNNRFAPAFDNIRRLVAGGVKQCLWRYHERLRTETEGGPAERNIRAVLGSPRADLVIQLLKEDDFLQSVNVELTASNASINRDADRQNSILLANFMGAWGEKILQLVQIASTPDIPEPVREAARKLAIAASAIAERTVRTFDQIRDPSRYIVDVEQELDAAAEIQPGPMQAIAQLLGAPPPGATLDPTKALA
jgi:hypothetical protein